MSDIGGLRKRSRPGTFIPRAMLRDKRLSFRARGILAHLLDRPAGWDVRAEALASESGQEGRDAILTALRELGACGYYRIERRRGKDGHFYMGTAIADEPVPEWTTDHAEYGGRPVPVEWKNGRYWVLHKDGSLTTDGFDGYEDEDELDPDPDDSRVPDGKPSDDMDDLLSSQLSPCPEKPVPAEPVPVHPASGRPVPASPASIRRTDNEEPKRSSSRAEPASQAQHGVPERKTLSGTRKRAGASSKRPKTERTPEQQAVFEEAGRITTAWWEHLKREGVTVMDSRQFLGCRESIVEKALTRGATADQVKRALVACGIPFPPAAAFERALVAVQTGRGTAPPGGQQRGNGRPANVWIDPTVTPQERQRSFDLWEGPSVMGRRIDQRAEGDRR